MRTHRRPAAIVAPVFATLLIAAVASALGGCGGGGGDSTSTSHNSDAAVAKGHKPFSPRSEVADAYAQTLLPFHAAPLSLAQVDALTKHGAVQFGVYVKRKPGPGTLSASGQAQLGLSIVKVAKASPVSAPAAGTATLTLRLTPPARRFLAKGHSMTMYLAIRFSRSRTAQQLVVPLKP